MSIESISASFESLSLSLSLSVCMCISNSQITIHGDAVFRLNERKAHDQSCNCTEEWTFIFFLSSTVWFNRSRKSNWKKVIERATMKELQSRPPYIFIARKLQTNLHLTMECNINTIRNLWMQTVHDQTQQYYFIIFQDMKLQCNCKMHK